MEDKKYYQRKELAKMLGVDPSTIYKWYKNEGMPIAFYASHRPRFDLEQVTRWLKEKTSERKNKEND